MKDINIKDYTIRDIEALAEQQAAEMAEEVDIIKGHQVYFVDFGGYFGYSVLVFADGHHIIYANDYALHHADMTRAELRAFYLNSLNNKLFTVDELKTVRDYNDKTKKEYFIRNYYGMRRDHISMFFIGSDEEREKIRKKTEKMIFSPVFLAYYDKKDIDFVKTGEALFIGLEAAEQQNKDNKEYWKKAFLHEMFNHEYGINWQGDFDICSCFGDCSGVRDFEDINKLFDACNFSKVQRSAYMAARREYYKKTPGIWDL